METALIEALRPYGPLTLIGGLIVILLRKELVRLIWYSHEDAALEKLLAGVKELYDSNKELGKAANAMLGDLSRDVEKIEAHAAEQLAVLRALLQELIRNNGHK